MAKYTNPNVIVFLDKSAVDNKTGTYEWFKVGQPCVRRMSFHQGK